MNRKDVVKRIVLTIIFIAIAYFSFSYRPASKSVTYRVNDEQITTTSDGSAKFFEWVGLFCLVVAVWFWRKELKATGIGFLHGPEPDIEQQSPQDLQKREELHIQQEEESTSDIPASPNVSPELSSSTRTLHNFEKHRDSIMQMLRENHALNAMHLA